MSRLSTPYTVTWSAGIYTITYSATYAAQNFSSAVIYISPISGNYFVFGPDLDLLTVLDWTICTSPVAGSKSALITAIEALVNTVTSPTLAVSTITDIGGTGIDITADLDINPAGTETVNITNATLTTCTIATFKNGANTITSPGATTTLVGRDTTDNLTNKILKTGSCTFGDTTDGSKKIAFDTSGVTTGNTHTIVATGGAASYTLPASSTTIAGIDTTDVFLSKTFADSSCRFGNVVDNTKRLAVLLSGATTAKTCTLVSSHTDNRSLTLPDATDTLVGKATTDIFSNKSFSNDVLPSAASVDLGSVASPWDNIVANSVRIINSVLVVDDGPDTRNITIVSPAPDDVMTTNAGSQTLTNKILSDSTNTFGHVSDTTKALKFSLGSATTGKTLTLISAHNDNNSLTFPNVSSDILCGLAAAQALTAKTVAFTTSGGTPSTLDFYESTSFTSTFTGGSATSAAQTINIVRLGVLVFISFPAFTFSGGTGTYNSLTGNTAVPTRFRPGSTRSEKLRATDNGGTTTPALFTVDSSGNMIIYRLNGTDTATNWTASAVLGVLNEFQVNWIFGV